MAYRSARMANPLGRKLLKVEKPARYIGGEFGAYNKSWDDAELRWCLVFPEVYEIGMSHLGLHILYHILNKESGILADRSYTPWFDMEELLKIENELLWGVETGKTLKDFDIVGITIPYELTYTNILSVLNLGGIPIYSKDRKENDPLIIGGGSGAFNPEPVADFFDAILLGDGEEDILRISNIVKEGKEKNLKREEVINKLSEIESLYISCLGTERKINKTTIPDLDSAKFPENPVVPNIQIAHDRAATEIQRGCTRGCRFCQAGMVYRPDRQRSVEQVVRLSENQIASSGLEECAFLSLSAGDYDPLTDAIIQLDHNFKDKWVHISLPSLRTESLNDEIVRTLSRSLKGGFTLAPEAATERLRNVINKGNTKEDLLSALEKIFSTGWKNLKLYFMIGLPTETDEDIDAIIDLSREALNIGRKLHKFPNLTINVSTFVPKTHTPFQWEEQISPERTREIQKRLRDKLKGPGLKLKLHNPEMSFLEGVFARGGRELSKAVVAAYEEGNRFDAWEDQLYFGRWTEVFKGLGIDPGSYLRERSEDESLPWDHLFTDLKKEFLLNERRKSREGEFTEDCSRKTCSSCGICDFKKIKPTIYNKADKVRATSDEQQVTKNEQPATSNKYTIQFSKTKNAIYLGHLDLMHIFGRAMRRADLPLKYSEGYNPRPKLSFGNALSLGIESRLEWCSIELTKEFEEEGIKDLLNTKLPDGIEVVGVTNGKLKDDATDTAYIVEAHGDATELTKSFEAKDSLIVIKKTKKGEREIDLKEIVRSMKVESDGKLKLSVERDRLSIYKVLQGLLDIDEQEARLLPITKIS